MIIAIGQKRFFDKILDGSQKTLLTDSLFVLS